MDLVQQENNMSGLNIVWTEKYRPKNIDDLVVTDQIKEYFKDKENLKQNILLMGHSGIGKTTLAKIIVNDLLDCQYLYINASDENGIDTIRTKVTDFIMTMSFENKPKVVILDEMDGLSFQAQQALRNLMEEYYESGFFILTANFSHKIIEPIKSRCAVFNIEYAVKDFVKKILTILKAEGVKVEQSHLEYIKSFYPDFRKCLNDIQKNKRGDTLVIDQKKECKEFVNQILDLLPTQTIHKIRRFIIENENNFSGDYNNLCKQLFDTICESDESENLKANSLIVIGECMRTNPTVEDVEINTFSKIIELKILWTKCKKNG